MNKEPKKYLNVRLEKDIYDWIVKQAKENRTTRTGIIVFMLKSHIYGSSHKGFIEIIKYKFGKDKLQSWNMVFRMNAKKIITKIKEHYIFETYFNRNLENTTPEYKEKFISALIELMEESRVKIKESTEDIHLIVEIDELINAVKNTDMDKLRSLINPNEVRKKRYMKGNFDDMKGEKFTKIYNLVMDLKKE